MSEHQQASLKEASKKITALSVPMALTQLMTVGSTFLVMAMVAHLGHDVLAASALIFSARISIIIIGASLLFSLSLLVGRAFGEGNYSSIGIYVQQGCSLALIMSIPIMILFWNMSSILVFLGQPKALAPILKTFFQANIWNVLPFLLAISNQQLCYGTRKQQVDLAANMIGVTVLLISAYTFIYGHFGMPQLGVKGLAYAMNLQGWTYFLCSFFIISNTGYFKQFDLLTYRVHRDWSYLVKMCQIGWPMCVQIGGEMLSLLATAAIVGWLGTKQLAAFQVVNQYMFLIIVPMFSVAQASGVLVGQAAGAKRMGEIKTLGFAAALFGLGLTLFIGSIFILFPRQLASFYLNIHSPENFTVVQLIVVLFVIYAISQLFDAQRNIITGSLRGLLDTRFPMYVSLIGIWVVGIPLGYILGFNFKLGVAGIATGSAIGMAVSMLCLHYRWHKTCQLFHISI